MKNKICIKSKFTDDDFFAIIKLLKKHPEVCEKCPAKIPVPCGVYLREIKQALKGEGK